VAQQAFCKWLTQKESLEGKLPPGMKYRLPTDEEWSRAVGLPTEQGTTPQEKDHLGSLVEYPWGRGFPPKSKVGNYPDSALRNQDPKADVFEGYTDGYVTTSPVGSFHANKLGLYDMGGNVWNWCEDWYDASQRDRVGRGSSWWNYLPITVRSACRKNFAPTLHYNQIGFRCVLSASAH
jgi:formylglycine-generating enzyme required for sulfatase activity